MQDVGCVGRGGWAHGHLGKPFPHPALRRLMIMQATQNQAGPDYSGPASDHRQSFARQFIQSAVTACTSLPAFFGSKRLRLRRKMHSRSGRRPEIPQNFRQPALRVEKPGFSNALRQGRIIPALPGCVALCMPGAGLFTCASVAVAAALAQWRRIAAVFGYYHLGAVRDVVVEPLGPFQRHAHAAVRRLAPQHGYRLGVVAAYMRD